ncbi:MAG: helix-turn-helix domain-containing protein [Hyphomonadaceae bacterium]|nr:helix-turn-helix domain-containing protein [Hyphomonadaceae bacterium]
MAQDPSSPVLAQIGRRIRAAREAAGLSLQDLALLCGISTSALSLIETGKRDLRVSSLYRIAGALRVPAGELLADGAGAPSKREASPSGGYDLGDYA